MAKNWIIPKKNKEENGKDWLGNMRTKQRVYIDQFEVVYKNGKYRKGDSVID
jgi:hypothetical protein